MRASINFYKEANFKETPIGKIPKDWGLKELKNIAKVVSGFAFPIELQGKNKGKYPFVKVGDLNNFYKYVISADNYVDDEDIEKLRGRPFPKGTIIFPKIGMAMRLNRYRILGTDALFDNNVAGLIPNRIDIEFLYYYLNGKVDLIKLAGTTTVPSITKSRLESIRIPFPPLSEQQKIVEVLSCVDLAIQKVNEAIARVERLKKGLMQQLLTKGIGHKEFKETPIGKIPEDWKVVKLGNVITHVKGKKPKEMTEEYREGHLPYLSTEYLRNNKVTNFVNPSQDVILVNNGDLILLWDGSNAGEFFWGKQGVLSSTMVKIKQKERKYNQKFLFYLLKTKENFLKGQTKGTGIPHVDKVVLNNITVPCPPFVEQQKIAKILSSVDNILQLKRKRREKLVRMKRRLMDLLLTGKVRVSV